MHKNLTLCSLFDGSGGFCLAAILAGIKPVASSEIAPFPTLVTHRRLPDVKHYGDVSKLSGKEIEPVDIITFGSPCQDLSIAGKQAGLIEGKRSSLFFEAIRIIKEMREATNGKKPRYAIWENVTGAFSSNGGADFNAVLDAFIGCVEDGVQVPAPEKGKWAKADLLLGDGWSVAYRTFDAQFWGVPQRRTRIYLVADFNGESAGEILFKPDSLSGDPSESRLPWKRTAGGAENSTGETVAIENHPADSRVRLSEDGKVQTLTERMGTGGGNVPMVAEPAYGISKEAFSSGENANFNFVIDEEIFPTLRATGSGAIAKSEIKAFSLHSKGVCEAKTGRTLEQSSGRPTSNQGGMCIVAPETYDVRFTSEGTKNARANVYKTDISRCLDTSDNNPDGNHGGIAVVETYAIQGSMIGREDKNGPQGDGISEDVSFTLNTVDRHAVIAFEPGLASRKGGHIYTDDKSRAIRADPGDNRMTVAVPTYCSTAGSFSNVGEEKTPALMARDYKDPPIVNETGYIVRRLTPTECARLQGFYDWWCEDLAVPEPSKEELAFWIDVWNTWDDISGHRRKSEDQIRKWLSDPYSDSEAYKMWGNGVALPCPYYVLKNIADEGK